MRGIVFIGGTGPEGGELKVIAHGAELLVAADSGLVSAERAGLKPHWVVGDMDSLPDLGLLKKYNPDRVLVFPPEKDLSDTELALNLCREKGCDEIWLAGGGSGRMDHLFAIYSLFEREDSPDRWFPGSVSSPGNTVSLGNCEIRCLKEGGSLGAELPSQSLISVLPLGKGPWEAESSGLKWPLNDLNWERGVVSLSNVALDGSLAIHSIKGRFLVIMPMVPVNFLGRE